MARPTNKELKEIQQRAKKIGLLYQFTIDDKGKLVFPTRKIGCLGKDLEEKYPEQYAKLIEEQKPIFPDRIHYYTENIMVEQNHFRAMKRIFEKEGWPGISQYERDVRAKQVKFELHMDKFKRR